MIIRRDDDSGADPGGVPSSRRRALVFRVRELVEAIRAGDDQMVERAVLDLSRSRRLFAPLAFLVGAFAMLFEGVRLLVSNWTLFLVEVLPAMWIWLAMLDLKAHMLHGKSFHIVRGPVLIPIIAFIVLVTAAGFYLNAVFAFAVAKPGKPLVRPAFAEARSHLPVVLAWGLGIGLALAVSTTVFTRWGSGWFAVSLSIVVAVMMLTYVSVPSRLIGMKTSYSTRDKLSATAVGGAIGAVICAPPYLLGRVGILMLGSHVLFIPALVVLALGVVLQSGATGAVKAIKMSAKLVAGRSLDDGRPSPSDAIALAAGVAPGPATAPAPAPADG